MFPLSPGLVDGKHRQSMGLAIWEFLWFLKHVTSDEPDGRGKFDGVVDFGNPISAARVAREIASSARCVQKNIQKLISTGYVIRKRELANGSSYVVKNSNVWFWKRARSVGIPTSNRPEGANDFDAGVRQISSPDANEKFARRELKVRSNKERKSRRAEEKNKILKPSPDGGGKNPTSTSSRSKVRAHGKSLSKSSHRSGDSSTDRCKENFAGAPAAKLRSPGELILIPPASSPPKETRHAPVERFIKSTYREANDGVDCAWNGRAGKALKDFLNEHPGWTTEKITQCVTNRFKSVGVALSDDPHFWIPKLASFLQGPKDKFGKTTTELAAAPKTTAPRAVEHVPPPTAQPDKVRFLARWKEPISHSVDDDETAGFLEEPRSIGRLQ
jgi:hypothetical protein